MPVVMRLQRVPSCLDDTGLRFRAYAESRVWPMTNRRGIPVAAWCHESRQARCFAVLHLAGLERSVDVAPTVAILNKTQPTLSFPMDSEAGISRRGYDAQDAELHWCRSSNAVTYVPDDEQPCARRQTPKLLIPRAANPSP